MTEDLTTRDITDAKVSTAISYNDGMLALAETPKELYSEHAVRLGTIVLTLCTQGTCTLKINGEPYTIGCNDLLVCVPNTVIEHVDLSPDVESRSIVLARTYAERLTMMAGNNWDMHLFLKHNPVLALTDEEAGLFRQYYDLLHTKLTRPRRQHHRELASALLTAFLYDFYDTTECFSGFTPQGYTSSDRLFKDFINLISDTYPRPREVAWYASRLSVTPKYFSAVVKERTGLSASPFIQRYIVADIVYLLRNTTKSIKEIAIELQFPNLSFFGKYVRHHLGCSPKHFRAKMGQPDKE